jgi:hypothetical protein
VATEELIKSAIEASELPTAQKTDFSNLALYMNLKGSSLERLGTNKVEILEVQDEAIAILES